jgi:hypothetical protein
VATKLLVLSVIPTEPGTAAGQHLFRVLDPTNHDIMMTVMASERDANRIKEGMLRRGARAPLWVEFRDTILIEDRAPLPRELRDKVGFGRRIVTWRPRPREALSSSRTSEQLTGAASAVQGVGLVASCVAVIAAQMYGVFVWLFLGYAIYFVGAVLLSWGLRQVRIDAPWNGRLAIGLPLPLVVLIGFAARNMIHPAFAWSNALLFFSR